MLVVAVTFEISKPRFDAFVSRVKQQARDSLELETGCHTFTVSVAEDGSPHVFLYEEYDDAAAFEAHLKSDHFAAFDAETAAWVTSKAVTRWVRQDV